MVAIESTGSNRTTLRKRRQQQRGSFSLPIVWTNTILITVTATITWMISNHIHSSYDKNVYTSEPSKWASQTINQKHEHTASSSKKKAFHLDLSDYTGPSRVFPPFEHPFPCFKGEPTLMLETPAHEGILFHRPMKTGSTTLTGIVLRLVHTRGQRIYGYDKCKHRSIHGTARNFEFGQRDKTKSFLFSIIRHPTKRAISEFFHFVVSAGMNEPTDKTFLSKVIRGGNHHVYLDDLVTRTYLTPEMEKSGAASRWVMKLLNYTSPDAFHHDLSGKAKDEFKQIRIRRALKQYNIFGPNFNATNVVQDILNDYNFIAVMERMDESLVVLQMLFNLTTKEILYTRARSGGSFSNGFAERPCIYIMPSFVSPQMEAYFASDYWQDMIADDLLLWKAAHKSLDLTIDALGRNEFQRKLKAFYRGQALAAKNCENRVRTMCSSDGERIRPRNTTCFVWGEGCDHECINELDI